MNNGEYYQQTRFQAFSHDIFYPCNIDDSLKEKQGLSSSKVTFNYKGLER